MNFQLTPPRDGAEMIVKVQVPAGGGDDCLIYDRSRKKAYTQAPICGPLRDLVETAIETHGVRNLMGAGKVFFRARVNKSRVHLLEPVAYQEGW